MIMKHFCKQHSICNTNFLYTDDRRHSAEERRLIQQLSKDDFDEEYLIQKISMLQLRLDEAQKTIQVEREYVIVRCCFCIMPISVLKFN